MLFKLLRYIPYQDILGGGLPLATQVRETAGPLQKNYDVRLGMSEDMRKYPYISGYENIFTYLYEDMRIYPHIYMRI